MEDLDIYDLDRYLRSHDGKIIHQIWFGIIPTKRAAKKAFEKLRPYRDTWLLSNPTWFYICWDKEKTDQFVKAFYPEHLEMYNSYKYHIQRCDAVRYFLLHRYGGVYADMDYKCCKPFDQAFQRFRNDIYFVETPNRLNKDEVHIFNSLMYSRPGHPFWKKLFIELEKNRTTPSFYGRHLEIMFTTGPAILNRVFNRYKYSYRLDYLPFALFHPNGLNNEMLSSKDKEQIFAIHLGKGSWESSDSKVWIFLYREYKILLVIIGLFFLPYFLRYFNESK